MLPDPDNPERVKIAEFTYMMSGTAYGTVLLHASPEAAAGGPLAAVRNGDMIEVDVAGRRITLEVSDAEISARLATWTPPERQPVSGYAKLYVDNVGGADTGADFHVLKRARGSMVVRDSH
jgi:L-arabonate dehydrase